MPDGGDLFRLQARHIGRRAAAALASGGPGRIGALFRRSFYVALGETWICVGPERLERGPLQLGCGVAAGLDWRASGLRAGQVCHAGPGGLRIGPRLRIETQAAEVWSPPPAPGWSRRGLARGLAILEAQVAGGLPDQGLAGLLRAPSGGDSALLARARPVVARLSGWLEAGAPGRDVPPLKGLVGLGPGLTPSGDDLVCGSLVALRALGLRTPAARLAEAAAPLFRSNGNAISRAHFQAAAEGAATAPLHDALAALAKGRAKDLASALERLDAIGHCSGWDALTGLVVTLRTAGADIAENRPPAILRPQG